MTVKSVGRSLVTAAAIGWLNITALQNPKISLMWLLKQCLSGGTFKRQAGGLAKLCCSEAGWLQSINHIVCIYTTKQYQVV